MTVAQAAQYTAWTDRAANTQYTSWSSDLLDPLAISKDWPTYILQSIANLGLFRFVLLSGTRTFCALPCLGNPLPTDVLVESQRCSVRSLSAASITSSEERAVWDWIFSRLAPRIGPGRLQAEFFLDGYLMPGFGNILL